MVVRTRVSSGGSADLILEVKGTDWEKQVTNLRYL